MRFHLRGSSLISTINAIRYSFDIFIYLKIPWRFSMEMHRPWWFHYRGIDYQYFLLSLGFPMLIIIGLFLPLLNRHRMEFNLNHLLRCEPNWRRLNIVRRARIWRCDSASIVALNICLNNQHRSLGIWISQWKSGGGGGKEGGKGIGRNMALLCDWCFLGRVTRPNRKTQHVSFQYLNCPVFLSLFLSLFLSFFLSLFSGAVFVFPALRPQRIPESLKHPHAPIVARCRWMECSLIGISGGEGRRGSAGESLNNW